MIGWTAMHQIDHVSSPHGLLWSMWQTHVHTGVHECEGQKPTILSFLRCHLPWVLKQNISLGLKFGHQTWLTGEPRGHRATVMSRAFSHRMTSTQHHAGFSLCTQEINQALLLTQQCFFTHRTIFPGRCFLGGVYPRLCAAPLLWFLRSLAICPVLLKPEYIWLPSLKQHPHRRINGFL